MLLLSSTKAYVKCDKCNDAALCEKLETPFARTHHVHDAIMGMQVKQMFYFLLNQPIRETTKCAG